MTLLYYSVSTRGAHLNLSSQRRGRLLEGGTISQEALMRYSKKTLKYP